MFTGANAFSAFAVTDIPAAKTFYAQTLGLDVSEENGMLRIRSTGGAEVLAYPKPDHEPATYTILNFPVEDIDAAVEELSARGVSFERYPGFEQDDKGVMRAGGPLIAWFTDPCGNILSVLQP